MPKNDQQPFRPIEDRPPDSEAGVTAVAPGGAVVTQQASEVVNSPSGVTFKSSLPEDEKAKDLEKARLERLAIPSDENFRRGVNVTAGVVHEEYKVVVPMVPPAAGYGVTEMKLADGSAIPAFSLPTGSPVAPPPTTVASPSPDNK